VLLRLGKEVTLHDCAHGPALGLLPGLSDWPVAELPIEPGGELLFYTDGLYENRDEGGKLWGIERMVSSAEELAGLPDHQFIDALIAATRDRTGRGDCDDVAVLHLRIGADGAGFHDGAGMNAPDLFEGA